MDLIQLYTATQRVLKSLKTSGLMPALKHYRASLRGQAQGDRESVEAVLKQASDAYVSEAAMYGEDETSVVNLLHLAELGKSSYWLDMTSTARSVEMRLAQSVSAYSKMMFVTSHLPGLLSLVRETSAIDGLRADEPDTGALVLRLYDAVEPASSPDRISRLIDAVDMIYSACASMSGTAPDSLRLISIAGVAVRSVIFHGEVQTLNAVRKVIADLNDAAASADLGNSHSVETIAAEMPLLDAIDKLEQLDAMSTNLAVNSGRDAQEGAIMLLECGAQLVDHDSTPDNGYIPPSVIALLDADGKSFDNIDSRISDSIDTRYDEVYEFEKQRLLSESADQSGGSFSTATAKSESESDTASSRGERTASAPVASSKLTANRKDSIDELIVDLNRFYGEQR